MTVAEGPPVVVRDVFPATVTTEGGTWRSARVIVTRDRLLVYLTTAGPVLDAPYTEAVLPPPGQRFGTARITLASGATLLVAGQRGCGCGNPLKSWRPWTPYRKAAL